MGDHCTTERNCTQKSYGTGIRFVIKANLTYSA